MRPSFLAPLVLALALLGASSPCAAAPPEAKGLARALADKGYEAYEAGRYDEAIDSFRRADQLFHAPTLVFAQAKASAKAGKLIEARALFQRVVSEKLSKDAPEEFVGAQNTAEGEIGGLIPRIPTVTLKVNAPAGLHYSVSIDGVRLAPSALDKAIEQNPGQHAVLVMPETGKGVSRNVILQEGESERVEVTLTGAASKALAPTPPPLPPPPPEAPPRHTRIVPAIAMFGVGAVGLGAGAALGGTTLSRASDLEAQCPTHKGCAQSLKDGFSTTNTLAALSTAGFVLAGAAVTTGVVLLLVPGRDEVAPSATVSIGPHGIGVGGTF